MFLLYILKGLFLQFLCFYTFNRFINASLLLQNFVFNIIRTKFGAFFLWFI